MSYSLSPQRKQMMTEVSLATSEGLRSHFWSRFPLGACNCWIFWPVLWVLSGSCVLWQGHQQHLLGRLPGTFKAARRREWLSWHPGILRHLGRERTNVFVLSAWFTGPSEPENEDKANKYVTSSVTEDGSSYSGVVLTVLMGSEQGFQPYLAQDIWEVKKTVLINTSRILLYSFQAELLSKSLSLIHECKWL